MSRSRERIQHPGEPAIVADDDVGIRIEGQEGRQRLHAIADVAAHQQQAVLVDVVAEGKLGEVAAIEGNQHAAQEAAHANAAVALIGGEAVGLALRDS